jgi:serine/threonine protein kinase
MEKYTDCVKIGEGGYGKVYKMKIVNSSPPTYVAVKYLKPQHKKDGTLGTTMKEISLLLSLVCFIFCSLFHTSSHTIQISLNFLK